MEAQSPLTRLREFAGFAKKQVPWGPKTAHFSTKLRTNGRFPPKYVVVGDHYGLHVPILRTHTSPRRSAATFDPVKVPFTSLAGALESQKPHFGT